jgi:hypothetical protein
MKEDTMTRGSEKIFGAVVVFSMFVICEGCASYTSVSLSSNQAKTVSMTANINREYRVIKHIKVEQKIPFLFLVRINPESGHPEVDEMLQPEIDASQGDAIVNVKITGEAALGDVFLPVGVGVLGGIAFAPLFIFAVTPFYEDLKTYTVEGDIVKYTEGKKLPEPEKKFDPVTGLPAAKPAPRFDPATGLPIEP